MISHLTYDSREKESEELRKIMKDEAAYTSDEDWAWKFLKKFPQVCQYLREEPVLDLACLDITDPDMLAHLNEFRKEYKEVMLMVIADATISPMQYLKPSVMPQSLLLRPADPAQIRQVVREFFEAFSMERRQENREAAFVAETREGKTFLPYSRILFFEAREKKVFVRAGTSEYGIYDTLENISERLPDRFLRCHRSYIINKDKIERVVLSQNMIELKDGAVIPVSRSYRTDVKNL